MKQLLIQLLSIFLIAFSACFAQVKIKLNSGESIIGIINKNDNDTLGLSTFENVNFRIPKTDLISIDKIKSQIVISSDAFNAHITRWDNINFYMVGESGFEFNVSKSLVRYITLPVSWSENNTFKVIDGNMFERDYGFSGFSGFGLGAGLIIILFVISTALGG
jgi:hypothetical protein